MADSTNLSLGPNSTLKLDRTVFDDAHSYRDISIRLTTGAFRFVTGNSDKAAYKIRPRSRPSACAAPSSISCPSAARPPWCCGTRRLAGLHPQLPVHRADQARRYRHHHLRRRQVHHPEDPTTRPGPSPVAPRRDFAAPPNMPTRRRRLRRLSMTAAIPPACCAGADDGKIHPQFHSVGRADRGDFAAADSGADRSRIGAKSRRQRHSPSPTPTSPRQPVVQPIAIAQPIALSDVRHRRRRPTAARPRPPVRIPARDRSTIWPSSASTR